MAAAVRAFAALALAIGLAVAGAPPAARAAGDPQVHVFIHVPLEVPASLPGVAGPWYCTPHHAHVDRTIPAARLEWYEHELAQHGAVRDHFGLGSWEVPSVTYEDGLDVAFENDDHLEVVTRLGTARDFVPVILRVLRRDTNQQEALGEIIGVAYGAGDQRRTRIMVTLPTSRASVRAILTLHHIFGNGGNGGASQYADEAGVHVYSGVTRAAAPRIEATLHRYGFVYTLEPETFLTVDAPACR